MVEHLAEQPLVLAEPGPSPVEAVDVSRVNKGHAPVERGLENGLGVADIVVHEAPAPEREADRPASRVRGWTGETRQSGNPWSVGSHRWWSLFGTASSERG